jgi:hypothetical protein
MPQDECVCKKLFRQIVCEGEDGTRQTFKEELPKCTGRKTIWKQPITTFGKSQLFLGHF